MAASMQRLRGVTVAPLTGEEVESVVAAAWPMVGAGAQDSSVEARSARVLMGPWTRWVSHAAAVLVGVLLTATGQGGCQSGAESSPLDTEVTLAPPIVKEVPVEVPVEIRIEVPVEVIKEVRVEVPVEVEVEKIVYRDRPVPHPLQGRLDAQVHIAQSLAQSGVLALGIIDRAYRSLDSSLAADVAPEPVLIAAGPQARAALVRNQFKSSGLEVRREGGRVSLKTRGTLYEVVPVLIDAMESTDQAVSAAAVDRLLSIRADMGEEALALYDTAPPRRRQGGIRGLLSQPAATSRVHQSLTLSEQALVWRDWWERQREGSIGSLSTGSI